MLFTWIVIAETRNARAQAADSAHQQIDLHARLRGLIQQANHRRVLQRVHLEDQVRRTAGLLVFNFAADQLHQPIAHVVWRDEERCGSCLAAYPVRALKKCVASSAI